MRLSHEFRVFLVVEQIGKVDQLVPSSEDIPRHIGGRQERHMAHAGHRFQLHGKLQGGGQTFAIAEHLEVQVLPVLFVLKDCKLQNKFTLI